MDKKDQNQFRAAGHSVVSEPAAIYYGSSERLRESGIITELKNLDREDTIGLIRFMQQHLDDLTATTAVPIQDPLDTLSQLGALIKATGKTSEQLIEERIDEKHAL